MKKIIYISLVILAFPFIGKAQQERMFSQYMFNGLFLNPAYAGTHKYWQTTGIFRAQWLGIDGAPRTSMIGADGNFKNLKDMGVGLIISHDKIGVTEQMEVMGNYAYHVKLGPGNLSLGLRGGVSSYRAPLTQLTVWDKTDVAFSSDINRVILPRFGFGGFYYTNRWYVGLAIPTLITYEKGTKFSMNNKNFGSQYRHYFVNGGYIFDVNKDWKIKPSFLLKYVDAAPPEVDVNFSMLFREKIWFAASYRSGDALVFLTEYQANHRLRIGYAYDITISKLSGYSNGSHEIMIGYDFVKEARSSIKFY